MVCQAHLRAVSAMSKSASVRVFGRLGRTVIGYAPDPSVRLTKPCPMPNPDRARRRVHGTGDQPRRTHVLAPSAAASARRRTQLVTPAVSAEGDCARPRGQRTRLLGLLVLVALIGRRVPGGWTLPRRLAREHIGWALPTRVAQPARSEHLRALPALLVARVCSRVLSRLPEQQAKRTHLFNGTLAPLRTRFRARYALA